MSGKLLSARFWIAVVMTGATAAAVLADAILPNEWWILLGIVIRDYFGRSDRAPAPVNPNGGAA